MNGTSVWGRVRVIPENELAVMACRQIVAAARGRERTPFHILYLYGETGTGKTALVSVLAARCGASTVVSAVDFARNEGNLDFRSPALLVLEDVHRLPLAAVERLVTTLDDRAARRRTTVVTATESPFDLSGLPRRLTSRLGGGLTVSLRPPSVDSRRVLLASYMKEKYGRFTGDEVPPLADLTEGGLRELFGAADQWVVGRTKRLGELNTTVRQTLAKDDRRRRFATDRVAGGDRAIKDLLEETAKAFKLSPDEIRGEGRHKSVVAARQTVLFLAIHVLGVTPRTVGNYLGRPTHSFSYVKDEVRWKMTRDPAFHAIVTKLEAEWRAKAQKVVARLSTEANEAARESDDA